MQAKAPRFGARRLRHLLQSRALAGEFVDALLEQARSTELERALAVWRRRFGQPPADLRERARQQRFLAGRGFEPAVIERVMRLAGRPPGHDSEAETDPDGASDGPPD
jgi:regulatory protein